MSWYFGFHYKGIIKEKYRKDMAAAFDKGCWSAVIDDELKRMIYALFPYTKGIDYYPEEETEFMEDITYFGGYCDSPDYLADFDEKSGLLVFFREWNHHHRSKDEEMRGMRMLFFRLSQKESFSMNPGLSRCLMMIRMNGYLTRRALKQG